MKTRTTASAKEFKEVIDLPKAISYLQDETKIIICNKSIWSIIRNLNFQQFMKDDGSIGTIDLTGRVEIRKGIKKIYVKLVPRKSEEEEIANLLAI